MLRRYLLILLPLILITGIVLSSIYYAELRLERNAVETEVRHSLEVQREIITANIGSVVSDLLVLSGHHELQEMLSKNGESSRKALVQDLLMFTKYKGLYGQVRFLDKGGMEIVRINFNNGNPSEVPASELQSKKERYYFKKSISLERGEIYVSLFDLNVENEVVEKPIKPMIRFGTPIYDSRAQKRGVLILNYLGGSIINRLKMSAAHVPGQAMLINPDGYWLMGPNPEDEWGFMYGDKKDRTFGKTHRDAWERIAGADSGQFHNAVGLYTFARVSPLSESRHLSPGEGNAPDPMAESLAAKSKYWWLVSFVPNETLSAGTDKLLRRLVLIYFIIIAILAIASWFIGSALRRKRIAEEALIESEASLVNAQRIARIGNWDWDIKSDRLIWSDEIYRIFGLGPHEFEESYDAFIGFVHPEEREFVKKSINESLHDKKPYNIEHRIVRADGLERIVHEEAEVIFNAQGQALRMSGTVQDITASKEAERKLHESELRYYTFFEQAADSIVVIDIEDGSLTDFNDMAHKSLGYSREEFQGIKIEELEVMESAEEIKEHIDKILNDGTDTFKTKHKTKEGEERDILVSAGLISSGGKKFIQSVWSDITDLKQTERELIHARDTLETRVEERTAELARTNEELEIEIAERKRIESALREKSLLTETLMDSMPCVALLLRPETREIIASNETAARFGAIPGKKCFSTWGQRDDPCPWCLAPTLWETGEEQHLVFEALDIVWEAYWVAINDEIYLHYAFDITSRVRAEEKLRLQGQLLENVQESVVATDMEGRILYWSKGAEVLYQYKSEEVMGKPVTFIVDADQEEEEKERMCRVIESGSWQGEYLQKRRDGSTFMAETAISLVRDADGEPFGLIGIDRDITERKKIEEDLKESEEKHNTVRYGNCPQLKV